MFRFNISRGVSLLSKSQHDVKLQDTKALLDSIRLYFESIPSRPVKAVQSSPRIPTSLPRDPISFPEILQTIERCVYPNTLQWQHPMFFTFYPSLISWETIQGVILAKALSAVCFTKDSCPVGNDIEVCVADWLAEMLQLPSHFLHSKGPGGGLTYSCASEAIFTAMSCARISKPSKQNVVYTSDQSNFVVTKTARALGLILRIIPGVFDPEKKNYPMSIPHLKEQIAKDKLEGLTPTFICAVIGGTNVGANDDIKAIGEVAASEDIWMHVDAAYAGYYCILPEMRYLLTGIEYVTSINMNTSKMMLAGFGHSNMWVKDYRLLVDNLGQQAAYLKTGNNADFKDWQLPLGRECKAISIWMILQQLGVKGVEAHVKKNIDAGILMEKLLVEDGRFEIVVARVYGLVVFRVKGEDEKTERLASRLAGSNDICIFGSKLQGKNIIRFVPSAIYEDFSNIRDAYKIICEYLD